MSEAFVLQVAEISARFAFADGAAVTFSDTLEVSLDCCICHRCCRTVIFSLGDVEGQCTPTRHSFPGKIVGKEASADSVLYRIEYWYEPFEDAKYPDRRKAQDRPTWGRVGFEVACPKCGQVTRQGSQNNIVRPWTCHCPCGLALFTESAEMPALR
jgi:hypothetical protein